MSKSKKTTTAKAVAIPLNVPGKVSSTGWQLPKKLEFDQWVACGQGLSQMEGALQWWLGDWWAYGEHAYGERKALFEEGGPLEGMEWDRIRDYGYVSKSVESAVRTALLEWHHHRVVAPLSPAQQRKWLERAVKEEWSARQLKSAIADSTKPPVTDTPAANIEETVRLNGGDVGKLSPTAQAQLAEKLSGPAVSAVELIKANAAEVLQLPNAQRALAEGEADRLDRLFGSGGFCMPLCTQVVPMLEMILDEGPQPFERFVACVDAKPPSPPSLLNALGGMPGFTSTILDQLADSGLVVPENNVWKLGPAFKTGKSLVYIPQRGKSTPHTFIVWAKEERLEQERHSRKRTALNRINSGRETVQDLAHADLCMAFKEGMAAWFDADIFDLPTKIFAGAVSSDHLRKVAAFLTRIADEQQWIPQSKDKKATRH